jgi:hypothetical protein
MKRKIFVIGICTLFIVLGIPSSIANAESLVTTEDDIEINISAGFRGKDIGIGFTVNLLNHKTENVTVFFNVTFDYIFMKYYFSDEWNDTLPSELPYTAHIGCSLCILEGLKLVSITVEVEDIKITRNGFSIGNLLILFK